MVFSIFEDFEEKKKWDIFKHKISTNVENKHNKT